MSKNKTGQILIVLDQTNNLLGYVLPGERCLLGKETLTELGEYPPEETPENVIKV